MRVVVAAVVALVLAGCSSPSSTPGPAPVDDRTPFLEPEAVQAAGELNETTLVRDELSFTGTMGGGACAYDGTGVTCATAAGTSLVFAHDRLGVVSGGNVTVSWSPSPGYGPRVEVYVAQDCPGACQLVDLLAEGSSSLSSPPLGTSGRLELALAPGLVLEGQALAVRFSPYFLTAIVAPIPVYNVEVGGSVDYQVPA